MNFKTVFTGEGEIIRGDVIDRIEEYVRPYYESLKKAKIYKRSENKELYSDRRECLKTEILNVELMEYIKNYILPIIQRKGKEYDHEFEILPSHMDLLVYQKGGHFDDHIDFISNHSNITQQYTLLIGLENCMTGKTFVWDKELNTYKGYEESIIRGGLIWFCSDTHHFSEKFEDEENEKTVLSLSIRAIKKNNQPKKEYYQVQSIEGIVFHLPKDKLENTMLEKMYEIGNKEENMMIEMTKEELELMRIYLENERELTKEEMEKIIESLSFYMLITSELKTTHLPSSIIKELNEKLSKNQEYILFDRFEPWMVEWSRKMNYTPFQVIYHCNDITEKLNIQDNESYVNKEDNKKYLKNLMKKFSKKDKYFGKRLEERIRKIYPHLETDYDNELNVNQKSTFTWGNEEFVILSGDGQYVVGDGRLGNIALKLNKKKNLPIMYRIKQIIHNHQYQFIKREIQSVFFDYTQDYSYQYYDSDDDKRLDKEERERRREKALLKYKKRTIRYGGSDSSGPEYESLFERKRKKSSKEVTTQVKKILKNVMKENQILDETIEWNLFEKENKKNLKKPWGNNSDSDSDFEEEEEKKLSIEENMNYLYLDKVAAKDYQSSDSSFSKSLSESSDENESSVSSDENESNVENESSESSDENESSESSMENESSESNKENESSESNKENELSESNVENENEEWDINYMIKPKEKMIQMNIQKNEDNERIEDDEIEKMFQVNEETNDSSIYSDLESDNEIIHSGKFDGSERNVKIYRNHNVHPLLYHESFDKIDLDHEKKKKICNMLKSLPLEEAYDYRDNILEKYYDEGCNEGGEITHTYKFKVYYVFIGFIRKFN